MTSPLRSLIRHAAYPGILIVGIGASRMLANAGVATLLHTGGVVAATAVTVGLLERFAPHSSEWDLKRRSAVLDLTHSVVSALVVVPIVRAVLLTTVVLVGAWLSRVIGSTLWPTSWPWIAQLALGVIVADFGAYWAHRSMHLTEVGWRAHVLHHSPEGLNFLAAGRSHPFNAAYTIGAETTMVLLLGITPEMLALVTVYKGVNGLIQHSNVDLATSPLSHVMATAEVHRWHHSRALEESNMNFGNSTMIWDRIFGTFFLPSTRGAPASLGVEGTRIPEAYLSHLAVPFTLERWSDPAPTEPDE